MRPIALMIELQSPFLSATRFPMREVSLKPMPADGSNLSSLSFRPGLGDTERKPEKQTDTSPSAPVLRSTTRVEARDLPARLPTKRVYSLDTSRPTTLSLIQSDPTSRRFLSENSCERYAERQLQDG